MALFWSWGEKKLAGLKNFINEKPESYDLIDKLRIELNAEAKNKKHSKDIRYALTQLEAKLAEIQEKFNEKIESVTDLQYLMYCRNFAADCRSTIISYEPSLMAAPGIWNKLKAYINAIAEYFGDEPCLDVDKSTLGLKEGFRQQLNNTKSQLTPNSDSEDYCIRGLF